MDRGDRTCPQRFRVAVTADIQTNPWQFERIVDRLIAEADEAAQADEPLVALLIGGDLAEAARDDEFETIAEILGRLPFPVAVTAGDHDIYRPLHPSSTALRSGQPLPSTCATCTSRCSTPAAVRSRRRCSRGCPSCSTRASARHSLAVMHHPPYAGLTGAGWSREDFAEIALVEFAAAGVDLVLAGHSHSLHDFPSIDVGGHELHEIIVGTAGANQGIGVPRYGYLRLRFDGDRVLPCFVEVPPPGYASPPERPLRTLDYCDG